MAELTDFMLVTFRRNLEVFVTFTDEEWDLFAAQLYLRKFKKRDAFVKSGTVCNEVGFIYSGSFRFFFLKEGQEISNYFCFKGELVSSYRSFLKKEPSITQVEAMEDAEVICFSQEILKKLCSDPRTAFKMEQFGRLVAEYLICCYEERVIAFVTQTPEERYCRLLEQQPDLLQQIPQHYVANYLGITPVSLSRIRKRIFAPSKNKNNSVAA